ncbi:histidine phosphatase family protein [Deinococcus humi]|uniref:2,3-bisphosphoglycerate-dependent phosphoglycerate mutase n=1 Tax=Deinococcus humi TaxID=662880 RepID=A0A7W8NCX5_9DEIO|nr:histidine phosphatase family protein [Deinococcus humi]MBB5361005.1 2,3-bisphosphoglycerate-dependent phosphoglycerate mutase [Deinococcus humi]GGO18024.1 phosphoglycerate mutase [Deinococcus humi]
MSPGFLLIRHARAAGQAPDAPLTEEGQRAAQNLIVQLGHRNITRIVSSPWVRAVDTARPLAEALGLSLETDGRLTERVLSGQDLPHWQTALKASFAVPALKLPGGESGKAARSRGLAALHDAQQRDGLSAVFTHGNLLALLLGLDYEGWAGLRNPDVWQFSLDGQASRIPLE